MYHERHLRRLGEAGFWITGSDYSCEATFISIKRNTQVKKKAQR